jgi:hypothetical protein
MGFDLIHLLTMAVFNVATAIALRFVGRRIDFRAAMTEKNASAPADAAPESYSRAAGMLGSMVMVTLFWALGNVVIHLALTNPDKLGGVISSAGTFFLYGSAMFLPYGANQIRSMFQGPKPGPGV